MQHNFAFLNDMFKIIYIAYFFSDNDIWSFFFYS